MHIFDRVKMLDDVDHILLRPGMYIGSTVPEQKTFFVRGQDGLFEQRDISYIPGMLKIVDEIISNSVDEYRRPTNKGLTEIRVSVNNRGEIEIYDNGGIDVLLHPEYNLYLPEIFFGNLKSGTNFIDTEKRSGVGTNGVGAALANIFSLKFKAETADNVHMYQQEWSNNMRERSEPIITKLKRGQHTHFTKISLSIDLKRFSSESLSDDFAKIIEKRCIDIACSNPGITIKFSYENIDNPEKSFSEEFKFNSFREHIELYKNIVDIENLIGEKNDDIEFYVAPHSYIHVGFVNGAECSKGSHLKLITSRVSTMIGRHLLKYHSIDLSNSHITTKYSVFVNINVINPAYDSQTKERLITAESDFNEAGMIKPFSKHFIKELLSSEIVKSILDWHKQKEQAEENRQLRAANKSAAKKIKIDKFIDANAPNSNRTGCELWIFEGDSAASGFRDSRIPATQACFKLKGKIKNVIDYSHVSILKNDELRNLCAAINLRLGEPENVDNLRFEKIIICTDMDHDGNCIAGMITGFFMNHFPGVVKSGMLYRAISPIIVATKKNDVKRYYSFEEFKNEEHTLSGYEIKYCKGIGTLSKQDYKAMLRTPILQQLVMDDEADDNMRIWFTGSSSKRKKLLESSYVPDDAGKESIDEKE